MPLLRHARENKSFAYRVDKSFRLPLIHLPAISVPVVRCVVLGLRSALSERCSGFCALAQTWFLIHHVPLTDLGFGQPPYRGTGRLWSAHTWYVISHSLHTLVLSLSRPPGLKRLLQFWRAVQRILPVNQAILPTRCLSAWSIIETIGCSA